MTGFLAFALSKMSFGEPAITLETPSSVRMLEERYILMVFSHAKDKQYEKQPSRLGGGTLND